MLHATADKDELSTLRSHTRHNTAKVERPRPLTHHARHHTPPPPPPLLSPTPRSNHLLPAIPNPNQHHAPPAPPPRPQQPHPPQRSQRPRPLLLRPVRPRTRSRLPRVLSQRHPAHRRQPPHGHLPPPAPVQNRCDGHPGRDQGAPDLENPARRRLHGAGG